MCCSWWLFSTCSRQQRDEVHPRRGGADDPGGAAWRGLPAHHAHPPAGGRRGQGSDRAREGGHHGDGHQAEDHRDPTGGSPS